MWCTWCPAGCSTTSSARLPRWLSRAQPTHTLQAPPLPYLRIGCLTMPPRKVSKSFSYFLFHILPLNRQTIKMYLSVSFCVKGKCSQNSIKSFLLKVSVLYLLNRKPCFSQLICFMFSSVTPSLVSSPGVVKIVVRQTAGKEGGPVPTLAVAPSPRVAPQASPSLHPHANTTPVRNTAPLQIAQRTPGPATAHYTIAPPGNPSPTPNQPHPPRPVLKVVQPPPSSTEQPGERTSRSYYSLWAIIHNAVCMHDKISRWYDPVLLQYFFLSYHPTPISVNLLRVPDVCHVGRNMEGSLDNDRKVSGSQFSVF